MGTLVDVATAIARREQEPLIKWTKAAEEIAKEQAIRQNLATLAERDKRVLQPEFFQAINQEIASDPGYRKLKNPHKAAWNEVKERLRLGEPQAPAQSSKQPSPVLGGGTPPPVPSSNAPVTPQNLSAAIPQIKNAEEEARVEAELKAMLQRYG